MVRQDISWLLPADTILKEIAELREPLLFPEWPKSSDFVTKDILSDPPQEKTWPRLPVRQQSLHTSSFLDKLLRRPPRVNPPNTESFEDSKGDKFGSSIDGETMFKLIGAYEDYWLELRPAIEDVIRRTPMESENETRPVVILQGFLTGRSDDGADAVPTVAITSSSVSYATQLRRALRRSGLLERYNFQVKVLNSPINKA